MRVAALKEDVHKTLKTLLPVAESQEYGPERRPSMLSLSRTQREAHALDALCDRGGGVALGTRHCPYPGRLPPSPAAPRGGHPRDAAHARSNPIGGGVRHTRAGDEHRGAPGMICAIA